MTTITLRKYITISRIFLGEFDFNLLRFEERVKKYSHIILVNVDLEGNEKLNENCDRASLIT